MAYTAPGIQIFKPSNIQTLLRPPVCPLLPNHSCLPDAHSRRAMERRKRRLYEEHEDEADRQREAREGPIRSYRRGGERGMSQDREVRSSTTLTVHRIYGCPICRAFWYHSYTYMYCIVRMSISFWDFPDQRYHCFREAMATSLRCRLRMSLHPLRWTSTTQSTAP